MKRFLLIFIVLLAFVLYSCSVSGKEGSSGSRAGFDVEIGITEGKKAPDFTLRNIDGEEVSLSDYKGKAVVINFFGVWCGWCKEEMPGFVKVFDEYKERNVELLVVDVGDTKEALVKYLEGNRFNIKPVMDTEQKVSRLYSVSGFPTSYIIDEKGIIKRVHRGFMDEAQLKSVLEGIVK